MWITGGHTILPPIEGLLPPTGVEPTLFQNSASEVAGIQVHATKPDFATITAKHSILHVCRGPAYSSVYCYFYADLEHCFNPDQVIPPI